MLRAVLERCVAQSPLSVMGRAALERVLGAARLELWCERTAQKHSPRARWFSSVYARRNPVVFGGHPAVRAAEPAQHDDVGASLVSVSNKRNHVETHPAAALGRERAREFAPRIARMDGERAPGLEDERSNLGDGTGLAARAQRLAERWEATGRAGPGKSVGV